MQSDRLLRGMHRICNHDLPNQIVALQSLLQLLQSEESGRLSESGLEYVHRLQNVTQRTSAIARFLKEMVKLQGYAAKRERLSLSVLAREIQGFLKQQFPHKQFMFDWRWNTLSIVGDYRTFIQALNELLTCVASTYGGSCRVSATSEASEKHIAIPFALEGCPAKPNHDTQAVMVPAKPSSFEQRMEIILSRALLAVSGATVSLEVKDNQVNAFTILIPNQ